ncbi:hypothetical protein [Kitasatospora sp. NBC_01300]|uniref:hypothetical protein n=1 Tax=Kitasatospora sp. NBC_01300 TaxID=2903574 RepID=UPI00352F9BC7|nr:hypothetical protein OG556_31070 [Kitasatospora sp. NBC_01300]
MASSTDPGNVDYEHTLSIDHDDLEYFAYTQLEGYKRELANDPGFVAIGGFGGHGTGQYTALLTGHGAELPAADRVKANFAQLAKGLSEDLLLLGIQMSEAQLRIKATLGIMDTAHEEAMTAAEMMEILNEVVKVTLPKNDTTSS